MASVSSLDKDLRNMRLDKYTPVRVNQTRQWIEEMLGERLQSGDLLEALKDGTALCKLVNRAVPNAVRFKESQMPFVQMENISHFLRACQSAPLGLPAHDCFLTVDLYESKDPAQVLQCIEAFSRRTVAINPSQFPKAIGGRKSVMSPQGTGGSHGPTSYGRPRGKSNASESSNTATGRISPVKTGGATSPTAASSWAQKRDMGTTSPAWNISQYGWTGGASQGNQGISFGARRQITSTAPNVPSLAEKERMRHEKEHEQERLRQEAEESERQRRIEREAEEERARAEEERRWAEETRGLKEREKKEVEAEQRRWEEEEKRWRRDEEQRIQEEKELELRLEKERQRKAANGDGRLQGQLLSQYKAEQSRTSETDRIKELERQLAEAKDREARYERERQERLGGDGESATSSSPAPAPLSIRRHATATQPTPDREIEEDSIQESEREFLQQEWTSHTTAPPPQPPRPLPIPKMAATHPTPQPPRPVPSNETPPKQPPRRNFDAAVSTPTQSPRPLPNPANYSTPKSASNRTDRYLSSNPAPAAPRPASHTPSEAAFTTSAEVDEENERRKASQAKTKAGGWASKSLLEREMEHERQRQQEWEENQQETRRAVDGGKVDHEAGSAPGQSWDVHQYGFTGGDNLNQGGGVYTGRRQILGPRPLGSKGT